jgi:hypothetical protein
VKPQTIFRVVNPNKSYTKISNTLLGDKAIGFEAKGFLASILMLPTDWAFNVAWLQNEYNVSRGKAYALVKKATEAGYCKRVHVRDDAGKVLHVEYHFSDDPADFGQLTPLPQNQEVDAQLPTSPLPEKSTSGKTAHIQRKQTNKEKIDTNTPPTPSARGTRKSKSLLPTDWALPDNWLKWAREYAPSRSLFISSEAESFHDYWTSEGRMKADWFATWRNWWRKACQRQLPKGAGTARVAKPLPPDHLIKAPVWKPAEKPDAILYRADTPEFNSYVTKLIAAGEDREAEEIQQRGWVKLYPVNRLGGVVGKIVQRAGASA